MISFRFCCAALFAASVGYPGFAAAKDSLDGAPHLRRQGNATQLVVDGRPFLILGGELHNSSSSSLDYLQPIWDRLAAQHLNTVLAGVSWELIEPAEGRFDFQLLDGLVRDARKHQFKLVLLWFGSWKNGRSSYAPEWVKRDPKRYPRVVWKNGDSPEVLTPLAVTTAHADARAFGEMLKHLRSSDAHDHTVLMVQVENEVGILGDTRDHSPLAEAAIAGPVPAEWFHYLETHGAELVPELRKRWVEAGAKKSGNWTEVFGSGAATDEIFMAWHYARYVEQVAASGSAAYPIPLYVNAWLNEKDGKPGDYPSGGPLAHLLNIWQAAAPHVALLAPDLYSANFEERCQLFTRAGNALFIPETNRGAEAGRNLFQAVGVYHALGFSPFAIDDTRFPAPATPPPANGAPPFEPAGSDLAANYALMAQIAPLVLEHQGKDSMVGFVLDKDHPSFTTTLAGTVMEISLDEIFGHKAEKGYGLVIATKPGKFVGAGTGFRVLFKSASPGKNHVGIAAVEEGTYHDGQWTPGRRLNGDENDQGLAWRFNPWSLQIEQCTIYRYD